MLTIQRQYDIFGALSLQSLCSDWHIDVYTHKNGKCVVKLFSGPCQKPYETRKFTNVAYGYAWAESFAKNYPKVVVTNFNY